eukprot:10309554-Alexandrium_andersonii.AAC.1
MEDLDEPIHGRKRESGELLALPAVGAFHLAAPISEDAPELVRLDGRRLWLRVGVWERELML